MPECKINLSPGLLHLKASALVHVDMFATEGSDYGIAIHSVWYKFFYCAIPRVLIFIVARESIAVQHHTFELHSNLSHTNDLTYYLTL